MSKLPASGWRRARIDHRTEKNSATQLARAFDHTLPSRYQRSLIRHCGEICPMPERQFVAPVFPGIPGRNYALQHECAHVPHRQSKCARNWFGRTTRGRIQRFPRHRHGRRVHVDRLSPWDPGAPRSREGRGVYRKALQDRKAGLRAELVPVQMRGGRQGRPRPSQDQAGRRWLAPANQQPSVQPAALDEQATLRPTRPPPQDPR